MTLPLELDLTNSRPGLTSATTSTASAATGIPFWGDFPEAWDSVFLKGKPLPGICKVTGGRKKRRTDRKNVPGQHGETVTYHGDAATEFDVTVRIWTADHLARLEAVIKDLRARVDVVTKVGVEDAATQTSREETSKVSQLKYVIFDVSHPALSALGITKCHILEYTPPEEESEGTQVYRATIKCVEAHPKPKKKKETGVSTPDFLSRLESLPSALTPKPSNNNSAP